MVWMDERRLRSTASWPAGRRGALITRISRLVEISNTWEGGDNMFTIKPLYGHHDDDDDDDDDKKHHHHHRHHHHHHHRHHHRKHDHDDDDD
jgi:hypothetical protein